MEGITSLGYAQSEDESGDLCPTVFSLGLKMEVEVVELKVVGWMESLEWEVMKVVVGLKEWEEWEMMGWRWGGWGK